MKMKLTDTITEATLLPNGTWAFKGKCKARDLKPCLYCQNEIKCPKHDKEGQ